MSHISRTSVDDFENPELKTCDMIDIINELTDHVNSLSALLYISNSANFDELDSGIYEGFSYGLSLINNSSLRLINRVKDYFYAKNEVSSSQDKYPKN